MESDGSDLVGGSIPMPFRDRRWIVEGVPEAGVTTELTVSVREDFGGVPPPSSVRIALQTIAGSEQLTGPCGIWIYTTQRLLSLSWASRVEELYTHLSVLSPFRLYPAWLARGRIRAPSGTMEQGGHATFPVWWIV